MYPTHSPTAVLPRPNGTHVHPGSEPADVVRTERDEVEALHTERDPGTTVARPADAVTPPPVRGTARSHPTPDDPFDGWLLRARAAGHPVQALGLGRYRPDNLLPMWSWAMPPNDLLDAARETARSRIGWFHAVLPDQAALLRLHRSVITPRPRGPRTRRGGPTATPWRRLVGQQHVGLCAISDTRHGVTTHVLEIPVIWLGCRILPVDAAVAAPAPAIGAGGADRDHGSPLEDRRPAAG